MMIDPWFLQQTVVLRSERAGAPHSASQVIVAYVVEGPRTYERDHVMLC